MATFSARVAASDDDADQGGSTVDVTAANLNTNGSNTWAGVRFQNVTIPNAATINSATLTVYLPSASYDDPNVTIYGNDVDDAAAFTTASNDLSGRTATTATVVWNASSLGVGSHVSPDIATIVQEIVNRAGWVEGNDMAILWSYLSGSLFRVRSYDGDFANAVLLTVDYTGGGGGAAVKSSYYARVRS